MKTAISAAAVAYLASVAYAQTTRDASTQAALTDPTEECTPYNVAPFSSIIPNFPEVWTVADILPNDAQAQALYNQIAPGIPDFPTRGTAPLGGVPPNFTQQIAGYNVQQDPACYWTATQCSMPKLSGLPSDIINCPEPDTWGLTFDDGPNCTHNAFYNYLAEQNQKATLFYIGSNVLDWPLQAQRGLNDGHQICVHTWSHRPMCSLPNEQAFAELYYTSLVIKNVIGIQPKCWRPPYGDVDDRIRYIANQLGLETVVWAQNTFDYSVSTLGVPAVEQNYQYLFSNASAGKYAEGGVVVLTHELNNDTMYIAQQEHPAMKQAFKNVVPMHVCQNQTQPYVESNYVYPNFEQYVAGTTTISAYTAVPTSQTTLNMVATASVSIVTQHTAVQSSASVGVATAGAVVSESKSAGESSFAFLSMAVIGCSALIGAAAVML